MADTKLLLVEDDENLAYMEKSCFEDIIGGYEVRMQVRSSGMLLPCATVRRFQGVTCCISQINKT